jgi:hypothetical protein
VRAEAAALGARLAAALGTSHRGYGGVQCGEGMPLEERKRADGAHQRWIGAATGFGEEHRNSSMGLDLSGELGSGWLEQMLREVAVLYIGRGGRFLG